MRGARSLVRWASEIQTAVCVVRAQGLGTSNGWCVCVCGHRASELQTAGVLAHMTREASDVLGDLVHRARGFSSHVYVTGDEGSINT